MELIGAQMKYSKFPCAEHSDEPLKAEKETFHISFVRLCGRLLKKFNRTIQNKNEIQKYSPILKSKRGRVGICLKIQFHLNFKK